LLPYWIHATPARHFFFAQRQDPWGRGGSSANLAALHSGPIAATTLAVPLNYLPEEAGFIIVVSTFIDGTAFKHVILGVLCLL
jgi:hypothetical protein